MTERDLTLLEATAAYFERAARNERDRNHGQPLTFNVVWPPTPIYLDQAAREIRTAVAELYRLGAENKGNG